jgi:hypothetical protein
MSIERISVGLDDGTAADDVLPLSLGLEHWGRECDDAEIWHTTGVQQFCAASDSVSLVATPLSHVAVHFTYGLKAILCRLSMEQFPLPHKAEILFTSMRSTERWLKKAARYYGHGRASLVVTNCNLCKRWYQTPLLNGAQRAPPKQSPTCLVQFANTTYPK